MERLAVIGNSGGGKSMHARKIAARRGLPYLEIDAVLWQPGWKLTPTDVYAAAHARLIGQARWVIDGQGRRESIPARLARATEIVLIDMPLWVHFWLAVEPQLAWALGRAEPLPAGAAEPPPLDALFRTIWEVDRDWMPEIRRLVAERRNAARRSIVCRRSTH